MEMKHVKGENKGEIIMYALSTCGWCKKTKRLLDEIGVEYYYTDVDLLKGEERAEAMKEVEHWNPHRSFPTLVINNECIVGYREDEIKEAIGL